MGRQWSLEEVVVEGRWWEEGAKVSRSYSSVEGSWRDWRSSIRWTRWQTGTRDASSASNLSYLSRGYGYLPIEIEEEGRVGLEEDSEGQRRRSSLASRGVTKSEGEVEGGDDPRTRSTISKRTRTTR